MNLINAVANDRFEICVASLQKTAKIKNFFFKMHCEICFWLTIAHHLKKIRTFILFTPKKICIHHQFLLYHLMVNLLIKFHLTLSLILYLLMRKI